MIYSDFTGIILAGGKSTRMRENKSLLKAGNKTIIERVVDLLRPLFPQILLITDTPDDYKFLDLEMYKDIYKDIGPLAGIHSGLINSETENNFIISCDIPLMTRHVIKFLIEHSASYSITIAKADNIIQQLCGIYKKNVIPSAEMIIKQNLTIDESNPGQNKRRCRVLELVKLVDSMIIDIEKEFKEYTPGTFLNMNNPSDYRYILDKLL